MKKITHPGVLGDSGGFGARATLLAAGALAVGAILRAARFRRPSTREPIEGEGVPMRLRIALVAAAALTLPAAAAGKPLRPPLQTVAVAVRGSHITIADATNLRGGGVHFRVAGDDTMHQIQLLRLRPGYSYQALLRDLDASHGRGKTAVAAGRRIFRRAIFVGGAVSFPHAAASFAVTLAPGTYYLGELDDRPTLHPITVTTGHASALPATAARIDAYDFGWRINGPSLPARGTITVRNTGEQPRFLVMAPVKPGTTRAQLAAYLRRTGGRETTPPPFALDGPQQATAILSPHQRLQLTYSLRPGAYALMTFSPDVRTGRSQALEGMYAIAALR
jgi:hypothetical protein